MGIPESVKIVEVGRSEGPFPTLNYRYVADMHYAVRVASDVDSWRIELSLRSLSNPVLKTSQATLFADHVEEPRVFAAKDQDEYIAWMEVGLQKWNRRMRIWQLLVKEEHRGKGIGSRLIGHAVDVAKKSEARMLILETQSCNVPAINFYLKHGFELTGLDLTAYSNEDIERGEVRLEFGLRI